MTTEIHLALIHHPVMNKQGDIVATAVTNLDIHDNARTARTFNLANFYIVTPLDAQIELMNRILKHWRDGFGARRVPNRAEAMNLVKVSRDLGEAVSSIMNGRQGKPFIICTSARKRAGTSSFKEIRERMEREPGPYLVLFGTGYGMAEEVFEQADAVLEPIGDPDGWNHLSVRSAVAITFDRLLSSRNYVQ